MVFEKNLSEDVKGNHQKNYTPRKSSRQKMTSELGLLTSIPSSPHEDELTPMAPSVESEDRNFEFWNTQKLSRPSHLSIVSNLTLNPNMSKRMEDEQNDLNEILGFQDFQENVIFCSRKIEKPKTNLVLTDFWGSGSTEPQFYEPQHSRAFSNFFGTNFDRSAQSHKLKEHKQAFYKDGEPALNQRADASNQKLGYPRATIHHQRNNTLIKTPTTRHQSGIPSFFEEDDEGLMTETRYIMGRLLKVKNRLDKNNLELDASMISKCDQSYVSAYSTAIKTRKSKVSVAYGGENSVIFRNVTNEGRSQNCNTPEYLNNFSVRSRVGGDKIFSDRA